MSTDHAFAPRLTVADAGGLATVTVHPECTGRGERMAMLEEQATAIGLLDGVVFERVDRYLERRRAAS